MLQNTAPKHIRENLARSRNYLRKGEVTRSLEAACKALHAYAGVQIIGQGKYEVEFLIDEFVADMNRHPEALLYLTSTNTSNINLLVYTRGKERELARKLETITNSMVIAQKQEEAMERERRLQRKDQLMEKGKRFLLQGNYPKGKAYLRRLIEGWPEEPELLVDVGTIFLHYQLYYEAVPLFEEALRKMPANHKAFGGIIKACKELNEKKRAEEYYLSALRTLGAHPRTLLNMATFYYDWRKIDEAYDYARRALQGDPSLTEAEELINRIEKK